MASEQARSSELSPAPGRLSALVQKSWSFALEAPKLPTLILLFVVLVAVFAPLLAQHDPELSVKPIKIFSPPVYSGGEWKTPLAHELVDALGVDRHADVEGDEHQDETESSGHDGPPDPDPRFGRTPDRHDTGW